MKRSGFMKRTKGLNAVGKTDHQRAARNLDDALSKMIRERDADIPCILWEWKRCSPRDDMECGHFVERARDATRFHPMNCNKESKGCNSSHVSGMKPDKGFPYGLAIDAKWGQGTATFLWNLANPKQEVGKVKPKADWTVNELNQLKDAARRGPRVYEQVYFELRPEHKPT